MTVILSEQSQVCELQAPSERKLPNFIYAGAPKAGSSSLFHYIKQHPDIYMSDVKEPFFFDFHYEKGLDWYEQHFVKGRGRKIIGEATVWYMRWPTVPERIARHIPDAKFLFVLRNPIDRAWSNYWHDFQSGHYSPLQPFNYVIRNEGRDESVNRTIVSTGFYHRHLKRFEQYFDRSQFLVVLYDDLKNDARAVARQVFEFLDVDPDFQPETNNRLMVTPGVRHYGLLKTLFEAERKIGLRVMPWLWKKRHFRQFMHSENQKKMRMDEADRQYLRELYRDSNQKLGEYLGRDLSHWK